MNLRTRQVLVTGAPGWLGTRLIHSLIHGLPDDERFKDALSDLRVRCLVLPGQDTSQLRGAFDQIELIQGDLRNSLDCAKFCQGAPGAVLFHTAGIIHPRKVADFNSINVQGAANLLQAAVDAGIRRAVVVSSNSPCGCNPHPDHLFDEFSPYRPYLGYGRSKMLMELVVKEFQSKGKMETVIVRPPWFYGPNQPPRQSLFFRMIRQGKAPIVGSGQNLRSMCYLDNLCQGLLLAAQVDRANGQTYWIADERPYSMNEIIDTIERLLEREFQQPCVKKRLRLPGLASPIAYLADSVLQRLGLYHQKIHVLSEMNKTIACSVGKAAAELGYRPTIALEEGMRRSLSWCVAQQIPI